LILASPLGVRVPPPGDFNTMKSLMFRGGRAPPKFFQFMQRTAWTLNLTPFKGMRFVGEKKARSYIDRYVTKMQKTESEEEGKWLKEYMFQIFMRPGTTENAIFI